MTNRQEQREIKFRAWDVFNAEMFPAKINDDLLVAFFREVNRRRNGGNTVHVMQFTGLLDSEGTEIYEGDIIRFTYWWFDGNEAESDLTGAIIYQPEHMAFALQGIKNKEWLRHVGGDEDTASFAFFNFDQADFLVIGNIHEQEE